MFQRTADREKFLVELDDVTSTFCLLFLTEHLNQSSTTYMEFHWIVLELTKFHDSHNTKAFAKSQKIPPTCILLVNSFQETNL